MKELDLRKSTLITLEEEDIMKEGDKITIKKYPNRTYFEPYSSNPGTTCLCIRGTSVARQITSFQKNEE